MINRAKVDPRKKYFFKLLAKSHYTSETSNPKIFLKLLYKHIFFLILLFKHQKLVGTVFLAFLERTPTIES